jgi:hypothetical protein
VSDNNGKGSRGAGKGTAVSLLGFNVANNGTFGDHVQGQDVTDSKSGLLSAVNELSSVHAFGTNEELIVSLIPVGIEKLDLGDGCASTRVVDDFLDNSTDVSLLLGVIERTKLDSTLTGPDMCLKDGGFTLTLSLWNDDDGRNGRNCTRETEGSESIQKSPRPIHSTTVSIGNLSWLHRHDIPGCIYPW